MIIDCEQMSYYRDTCDIGPFITAHRSISPTLSSIKLLAMYLNDRRPDEMKSKSLSLYHMKLGWHQKLGIQL